MTSLPINTNVIVSKPVGRADRQFRNRSGKLISLTQGWAKVRLHDACGVEEYLANKSIPEILVHPESLERAA